MRRTFATVTVPVALAAAVLVSGCGTERPGADPVPAPERAAPAAPAALVEVAPIPEDFPLAAGMLTDVDTELTGPGRGAPGLRLGDTCPGTVWPRDGVGQRLALRAIGPEYAEVRELVTYPSEEAAAEAVAGLRADVAACTPDEGKVVTSYDEETGTDAVTFALTYEVGLGGAAYQVLRVGPAVLAVSDAGEFSADSVAAYVPELTEQNGYLRDQMGCTWGAGCPDEPVTLAPTGAGPLEMGASLNDLRAAAPAVYVALGSADACTTVTWTNAGGATLHGAVDPDRGLAFLVGRSGVTTPEGLTTGQSLDDLRAAYPEAARADNGLWFADRGDTDYTIGVADGLVESIGVVADDQVCVG